MSGSPTLLDVPDYLRHLGTATERLVASARRAGLEAEVPTCPGWTVRRLIGHQGLIHRWAAANLKGAGPDHPTWADPDAVEKQGRGHPDPPDWLASGAVDLAKTIHTAPDDVEALTFLTDAPAPRLFWARRQAHETAMHAVDALAAELGRLPTAAEADLDEAFALDGIDELLTGFVPREKSRLRSENPETIGVVVGTHAWCVQVSPDTPATVRCDPDEATASDHLIEGSADAVYLALWHRGAEVDSTAWPLWEASAIT